jgi:hypothetical protein
MSEWQTVGRQLYRIEADTLLWRAVGDLSRDELSHLFHLGTCIEADKGYALFHVVATPDCTLSPDARRFLGEFHRTHKAIGATAVCGMSPLVVMTVELVLRAIRLVARKQVPTRFFRTEAEARTWLGEQRTLFQRGAHPSQAAR